MPSDFTFPKQAKPPNLSVRNHTKMEPLKKKGENRDSLKKEVKMEMEMETMVEPHNVSQWSEKNDFFHCLDLLVWIVIEVAATSTCHRIALTKL